MAEVKKWNVTYTKHIKQKRKVYQDGILELHPFSNKVILYDGCEKLLESRFVKKDDALVPGELLAFESYLVDIGDFVPQGDDHKAIPKFSQRQKEPKINRTSQSFHTRKYEGNANLGQKKVRSINISPSQKLIREYKKNEMTKYGSSPGCPERTKTSKEEWQVLYTTQITQKAKKYHDGFLQLHSCGSQRKQVLLYDETRRLLESRFLRMDEIIKPGESIVFDGHLVDIGELNKDHQPPMDFKVEGRICKMIGETKVAGGLTHSHLQLPAGEYQKEVPSKHNFISAPGVSKMPIRSAHEILSILRKTKSERDVADGLHGSQSSSFFQKKEHLQNTTDEGSTVVVLDEENTRTKPDGGEIPKHEDVKSGTTNILHHIAASDCAVGRTYKDGPGFEPKSLATLQLDLKTKIAAVLQHPLRGDLESGNHTELFPCEANPTGGPPAVVSGSDTHQLSVEELRIVFQPCADNKEIDTRWLNGGQVTGMSTLSNGTPHEASDFQIISEQDKGTEKTEDFPSFDLGF